MRLLQQSAQRNNESLYFHLNIMYTSFIQKCQFGLDGLGTFFIFFLYLEKWRITKFNEDNAHSWSFPWVHTLKSVLVLSCWVVYKF